MIPLDEARAHVLARCTPGTPRAVALAAASGLVLAADVVAAEAVPPFDNSAMDGVAVRAADTAGAAPDAPVVLDLVGTQPAGLDLGLVVGPGQAVRLMTGAPFPAGADAVVIVEDTAPAGGGAPGTERVAVLRTASVGQHRRHAGDDVRTGDVVVAAGTRLAPAMLGVLASVGVAEPRCVPRPRVGVLSTGDELVPPGVALRPGQIRDSNRVALVAQLTSDGFDAVDLGVVRDDEAAVEAALASAAAQVDAVLTSGGVSMGDFDPVKAVLGRVAADARWMQVAIRPAKPFAFALLAGPAGSPVPLFGLPGNPVSSLVSYAVLARPGLRRLAGIEPPVEPPVAAVAGTDLARRPDGKLHLVRVRSTWDAAGRRSVVPCGGQGSHQLTAMAAADALALLPDGDGIRAGEPVDLLDLRAAG